MRLFPLIVFCILVGCSGGNAPRASQGPIIGSDLAITTSGIPAVIVYQQMNFQLEARGGVPPYTWALAPGSSPPSGFVLQTSGLIIGSGSLASGTSKSISPPFGVVVTDARGNRATSSFSITIIEAPVVIDTIDVSCTTNQKCYERIATASGGSPPYHFQSDTFREGAPPMGTIVDIDGFISGTPSREGEYTVGVCATDKIAATKCDHAKVTVEKAQESAAGTWSGSYSETERSGECTNKNAGTMTLILSESSGTVTGSLADQGGLVASDCGGSGGGYSFTGSFSGKFDAGVLTGQISSSSSDGRCQLPMKATISGDAMIGSYTGSCTFVGGNPGTYVGSFSLKR